VELELGTAPLVPDPNGPPVRRYPDGVSVATTVRLLEGPHEDVRAGVVCMTSEQGADGFYAFFAEPDGEFSIVKWAPLGAPLVLDEGRRKPKKSDGVLTVAATCRPKGTTVELTLALRGDEVAHVVDRDPLDFDTQVGLVVEQPDAVTIEPVVAEFTRLRARPLPSRAKAVANFASVSGDKERFCELALTVGSDITDPGNPQLKEENAAKLEAAYRKLVKPAPTKKLKSAVRTIVKYFGRVADGEEAEISITLAANFQTANITYGMYLATKCAGDAIITQFTLPDGTPLTLPGGGPVTLPEGLPGG
jgi:hypothetical protein